MLWAHAPAKSHSHPELRFELQPGFSIGSIPTCTPNQSSFWADCHKGSQQAVLLSLCEMKFVLMGAADSHRLPLFQETSEGRKRREGQGSLEADRQSFPSTAEVIAVPWSGGTVGNPHTEEAREKNGKRVGPLVSGSVSRDNFSSSDP